MKKPKLTQKEKFKQLEKDQEAFEKYRLNFVKAQLRRASVWKWPAAGIAIQRNKIDGMVQCDGCKSYYTEKNINRDHIEPVMPVTGWISWENYIERLFVKSSGIQILCIPCHDSKTMVENIMRVKNNQKPIKLKKKK